MSNFHDVSIEDTAAAPFPGAALLDSPDVAVKPTPTLLERMLAAEIDATNPPPPDDPIFHVAGRLTATTGNIGALIARAKAGKSAVIGAHVAACLVADGLGDLEADTLGIRSEPPKGKAVIVIDTEQSPGDACGLVERSLRRLGLTPADRPAWLRVFAFAGWRASDLATGLPELMASVGAEHGGIHAVFVDGGADLAGNVNDPETAADLCAGWHALAIKFHCHLLIVIHSNEGEKADDVARGWLGKQLRRKAESNLQLKRTDETVTIFAESGQRRAPILEKDGPCFRWSDEVGMHVSVEGNPRESAKRQELLDIATEVFANIPRMSWKDLKATFISVRGLPPSTAERRIREMEKMKVIRTDAMGLKERVL